MCGRKRAAGLAAVWRVAVWWGAVLTAASGVAALGSYPRPRVLAQVGGDSGEPLLLTPLLERGRADEARRRARVPLTDALGCESYSGYFTVNKTYEANLFAWYFPPVSRAPGAPLLVWLQGGPGASSLYGLFAEHGPLRVESGRVVRRNITWAVGHHVLYVDNPVGTGFSFARDLRALCRDEECVGRGLRSVLVQLVAMFPTLRGRELYVTGESYAGKYVPALAHAVLAAGVPGLTLAGVAIGNGLTDPLHQLHYSPYLYQHGLLDAAQRDVFAAAEARVRAAIIAERYEEAFRLFDSLLNGDLISGKSLFYNMTGYEYYFNLLHARAPPGDDAWTEVLARSDIRRALHVGAQEFSSGRDVERALSGDVMRSTASWVSELLGRCRALVYNGQLDIIVAFPLTESYLQRLEFPGAASFRAAERRAWRVGGELAGYARVGGNLTEVLVRNAGHMVPADQPLWALDLITRFTRRKPFH